MKNTVNSVLYAERSGVAAAHKLILSIIHKIMEKREQISTNTYLNILIHTIANINILE